MLRAARLERHRFDAGIGLFAVTAVTAVTADERRLCAQLSNTHAVVAYELAAREIVLRALAPTDSTAPGGAGPAVRGCAGPAWS